MDLQEKEAELQRLESALTAKTAALQEKELQLSEQWNAGRIHEIPISDITANPHQPRSTFDDLTLFSLANSIREHGILQPLTVRRTPQTENTPYQLIAGERRLRAASAIGMTCVPCIILDADNRRAAELALIENLQRENLNMFEQAGAIAALIDMHAMTQEEIARTLSVSQSYIANKLRLLRLSGDLRELILSSHLTERHARAFLRIKDAELRRKAAQQTAEKNLNVAQTEEYIDSLLPAAPSPMLRPTQEKTVCITETEHRQHKKCILKDLRLFFNTIDRALSAAREAGVCAECIRSETDDRTTLTVVIRHAPPQSPSVQADATIGKMPVHVSRETEIPAEITNIQ
ncbi:MAG: ParB/RepB/Spo0J family partition protein [Clostridia bacterium]|nr:ParB/RepB/Spo0J family partition protein [Clostridia bacterium]